MTSTSKTANSKTSLLKNQLCLYNFLILSGTIAVVTLLVNLTKGPSLDTKQPLRRQRAEGRYDAHHDLHHFVKSRDLDFWMNNIELLLEPTACSNASIIVMVPSIPSNFENRQAVRETWGTKLPTYFLLGMEGKEKVPSDIYEEASQYDDVIVYNLLEHYQNLTIKSMLMIKWTLDRCANFDVYFKTDDDVLVNPWMLKNVIKDHPNFQLIGSKKFDMLSRDENSRWFVPTWLQTEDAHLEYLLGAGYIINGTYLKRIYERARIVPLMNLEDVYLTFYVAKLGLRLKLTDDLKMNAFTSHYYVFRNRNKWSRATLHAFKGSEMYDAWKILLNKTDF